MMHSNNRGRYMVELCRNYNERNEMSVPEKSACDDRQMLHGSEDVTRSSTFLLDNTNDTSPNAIPESVTLYATQSVLSVPNDKGSSESGSITLPPASPVNSEYFSDHSEYVPEESTTSTEDDAAFENQSTRVNILEGMEIFPEPTDKSRKRVLKVHKWRRNVAKQRRALGEEYMSSRNKIVPAVTMRPPCPATCRYRCFSKVPDEERLSIFNAYWGLADYTRQRDFIHSNTTKAGTRWKTRENTKRNSSISFYLPVNGEKVKICKTMFINTLGIKKGVVDIAMQKRTLENTSSGDKRGKYKKKVTDTSVVENIKSHIESFPSVPSHYCRSGTKRQYLCSSLNITIMYKLYCDLRDERNEKKASEAIYRKIFNQNYNLGFHRPRKDQCRLCMGFQNASDLERQSLEADYSRHLESKELARAEKRNDKVNAGESNGQYVSANFDLQQVLLVPSDPRNNALFYKRRLATYNFTIYNVVSKQGDCFMWSETQGKRGSCEIGSCVHKYLRSLPVTTKFVSFFCDRCGGQNLNKFMAAMCMIAVQEIPNIEIVDLKFSVVGHSEMECDSMHSAIGREFKRVGKASWPADWETIARCARRKGDKPYVIHRLETHEINDYKQFVRENMCFRKKDENGDAINWQKICWLRFRKARPFVMEFKECFKQDFKVLNVNRKSRRRSQPAAHLQALYKESIPISELKYQDLISLFSMMPPALDDCYKPFYLSLPHCGSAQDTVSDSEDE